MGVATANMSVPVAEQNEGFWLRSRNWDMLFITLSVFLVPLPYLFYLLGVKLGMQPDVSRNLVNGFVAVAVGGPHMMSTMLRTGLDNDFKQRYPMLIRSSIIIPIVVVSLAFLNLTLLLTIFFFWASLHVLHQVIYLTDCYRERSGRREPAWSRAVDYGLILSGLYPIGLFKIAQGKFGVGGVLLPFPAFLRPLHLPEIAAVVFAACLIAWIGKTTVEIRRGTVSMPKTLLIGITTVVSFLLPLGSNLDILFQGYNTWHSFQYLFLLWLINRLRDQRGELEDGVVRRLVRRQGMGAYYLCFLGATGVLVVLTLLVRAATPLTADQSYFVVVLSVLLMHYYFDHFLFSHPKMVE